MRNWERKMNCGRMSQRWDERQMGWEESGMGTTKGVQNWIVPGEHWVS